MNRRHTLALLMAMAVAPLAQAEPAYPTKPIHLIVPFNPGGASDAVGRLIGKALEEELKQPVVVENRAGGATSIATSAVARAQPDGYTLLMGTNLMLSNPFLYKSVSYKVEQLAPIAMLFELPLIVNVSTKLPVKSVEELVAYAKEHPGKLNYGTTGPGTTPHMFMEQFRKMAGIDIQHIPFNGSAAILQEMIAGRIHLAFDGLPPGLAQHKAGNVRTIGALTEERLTQLPEVPTLKELGYPIVSSTWYGILVPAGTPPEIVDKLNTSIRKVQATDEYQQQLANANVLPSPDYTPQEMGEFMKRNSRMWQEMIEPMNLQLD